METKSTCFNDHLKLEPKNANKEPNKMQEIESGIWELPIMEGKNPAHTGAFFNPYDPRDFTDAEVIARESGQNALDAGKDIEPITQLEFHKLTLSGNNKEELLRVFGFKDLLGPRIDEFGKNVRTTFIAENLKRFLDSENLNALLIRDFNTCGLGGEWNQYERTNHFSRLLCGLGFDDKADENTNSGGSFGLGKTAYANSSLINTVLYHSTFQPTTNKENVKRRLMISGVYPKHIFNDKVYGGYAYFGKCNPNNKEEALPFENDEAKEIWDYVGTLFGVDLSREDNKTGTDILIFMDSLELSSIKKAIEDYYFPAIIDKKISVKFFDENRNIDTPKPREREDLDQFIRLVINAKDGETEKNNTREVAKLSKIEGKLAGRIAFEAAEIDEAKSDKKNCVAIMRGTGMIINYLNLGSEQHESAVGAFVADKDIWKYLIASENAAHSEWNKTSRRLKQDYPEDGETTIRKLNKTLKNRFIAFQKKLSPDIAVIQSDSGRLARKLSEALSGRSGNNPVPPGKPNPVSMSLKKKSREDKKSVWRLLIESNQHTPPWPFPLKIQPTFSLAGDSKKVRVKYMAFAIKDSNGETKGEGEKPKLLYTFKQGDVLDLTIEFDDPKKKNFIVHCKCVAF